VASVRDGTGLTVGRSAAGIARNARTTMIVAATVKTSANTNWPDGAPRCTPCRDTTAPYVWRRTGSQPAYVTASVALIRAREDAFEQASLRVGWRRLHGVPGD
jgi:hypothetical protein